MPSAPARHGGHRCVLLHVVSGCVLVDMPGMAQHRVHAGAVSSSMGGALPGGAPPPPPPPAVPCGPVVRT
jgi:hypothetical protein